MVWQRQNPHEIFCELVFCLMTPQSKAKSCQVALDKLLEKDLLTGGCKEDIAQEINAVRFRNNKAGYIVEARHKYCKNLPEILGSMKTSFEMRSWLVGNIKGMGMKEASHFLRNLGFGDDIAILDRHILKNLVLLDVIPEIPKSLNERKYLEIEDRMRAFSQKEQIPISHLDLVLWYKEAGEIFK